MNLLDLVFPRQCLGCGRSGIYFCPGCAAKIKLTSQICPVCERPSPFGETHPSCRSRYSLNGLASFFTFEGVIRTAIHKLKYRLVTDLKTELFSLILREWPKETALNKFIDQYQPIVLPIPLYWLKENQRGFNQSSLFSQEISRRFNLPFSDRILLRNRSTTSQTKLTMEERRRNVEQAFVVNPKCLPAGRQASYLLVDDVWTTGATLKTAGNLLKRAGAKMVWGLTIAR